jgi:hypothetical protein
VRKKNLGRKIMRKEKRERIMNEKEEGKRNNE